MIEAHNRVLATLAPRAPAAKAGGSQDPAAAPVRLPPGEINAERPQAGVAANEKADEKDFQLFGKDGFDFYDVLDIVNPLQHIPIVSTIYRRLTGDELSPGARIAGATLFGGPIGAALAMADSAVEYKTGKDTGANVYAMLFGDEGPIPTTNQIFASNQAPVAAPWQNPDALADGTVTHASLSAGGAAGRYVAEAKPDLGALGQFTTPAGSATVAAAAPKMIAAPWQNPDLQPLPAPANAAVAALGNDVKAIAFAGNWKNPDLAQPAVVADATPKINLADATSKMTVADAMPKAPVTLPLAAANALETAQAIQHTPAPKMDDERPMPSDAAKAQAINALAAMPTSQTTAAVSELAQNGPSNGAHHHMAPPAADIPRGAGASLGRTRTAAYAKAMTNRTPEQIASAQAADARANAIMAANGNADAIARRPNAMAATSAAAPIPAAMRTPAQNDWMLDAMRTAMAKYEAGAKLRNANTNGTVDIAVGQ